MQFGHCLVALACFLCVQKIEVKGCSCLPNFDHLQTRSCEAEILFVANVTSERVERMTRFYTVELLEVFKGRNNEVKEGATLEIDTAEQSATCGVTLQLNALYLLDAIEGLNLCSTLFLLLDEQKQDRVKRLLGCCNQCEVEVCKDNAISCDSDKKTCRFAWDDLNIQKNGECCKEQGMCEWRFNKN